MSQRTAAGSGESVTTVQSARRSPAAPADRTGGRSSYCGRVSDDERGRAPSREDRCSSSRSRAGTTPARRPAAPCAPSRDQLELVSRCSSSTPRTTSTTSSTARRSSIDDDGERVLEWPSVDPVRTRPDSIPTDSGLAVHVLLGTEPSRGWKTFAAEVIDADRGRRRHRPSCSSARCSPTCRTPGRSRCSPQRERRRARPLRARAQHLRGARSASCRCSADAAERAGIPTLSIWASVPHYVHNAPSPKATLALHRAARGVRRPRGRPRRAARGVARPGRAASTPLADDDEDMAAYIRSSSRRATPSTPPRRPARRSPRSSSATCGAATAATAATAAATAATARAADAAQPRRRGSALQHADRQQHDQHDAEHDRGRSRTAGRLRLM